MSNHQEFFLLTKDLSNVEVVIKRSHTLEFQSESNIIETLSSSSSSQHSHKEDKKSKHQEIEGDSESSTSKLKEKDEKEEDDDGFKTPTSLDHKIPVPSQCPPAPRKTTKPCLKRKASYYNNHCCRHPLDLSKEVFELLFPTQHSTHPLSASQQSTKKVRRQEQHK